MGKGKVKLEEHLEMNMKALDRRAMEDLKIVKRLEKKLKVKDGKLSGIDDGINTLFDGLPSLDTFSRDVEDGRVGKKCESSSKTFVLGNEASVQACNSIESNVVSRKKKKKSLKKKRPTANDTDANAASLQTVEEGISQRSDTQTLECATSIKYVAPYLRCNSESELKEHSHIRRQVRGLLNRLSASNVESITGEIANIFRSVSRSIGTKIIGDEVLAGCLSGPRGNEQYAAAFAAFVGGMACTVGMDFSAKLVASLAKSFQDEYQKEDNLSLRNVTLLLSYIYIFGLVSSDLIYDFLTVLSEGLSEIDVSTILTVLNCCGMKLRSDDPAAMKNFIQSIQNQVKERNDSLENCQTKRMEFMIETILHIKNNKRTGDDSSAHARTKKWLQKLKVEDVLIRGLKWRKLLDPNKKGQWWLSGDMASSTDNVEVLANTIDKEALEAKRILELAAAQRMNTDSRKAIFCIVMSAEDYLDAFEKLLRLNLQGNQDRDVIRVLMDCCLQEKVFNHYYTVLCTKLCEHEKNHKFTLQYCIWDQFKELESMPLLRSMHLAKFVAQMVSSFTLSLAVLKSVELCDVQRMTAKKIMHFRMLFEFLLESPDSILWNVFTRVAIAPDLEALGHGIEFFIREHVVKSNKALAGKYKLSKKALGNSFGVLM